MQIVDTVCYNPYSALHDSAKRSPFDRPRCAISAPNRMRQRTAAVGTIALRRSLTTAVEVVECQIERIRRTHRMPMGVVRCNWPRSPTTHPRTTKVDNHANRASAASPPLNVRRLVVEPIFLWMYRHLNFIERVSFEMARAPGT